MSARSHLAMAPCPVVLFARLDDPELAPCYRIGAAGAAQLWSPSPSTGRFAEELHRLASRRGALFDVSRLCDGSCAADPRKAVRAALGRVIGQIGDASPALGRLLGDELEVMTSERRVLARLRRSQPAVIQTGAQAVDG